MPTSVSGTPVIAHIEATPASARENVMATRAKTPESVRVRRVIDIN